MPNLNQAPELKAIGKKDKPGAFMRRPIELEEGMMNLLGPRDFAQFKLMMFLTGNAADSGFRIAEKTVCNRCNISEAVYKTARAALVKRGWLIHEPAVSITVNYTQIYKDIEEWKK